MEEHSDSRRAPPGIRRRFDAGRMHRRRPSDTAWLLVPRSILAETCRLRSNRCARAARDPSPLCLSISVAEARAEALRRALFTTLYGRIKQIVVVHDIQTHAGQSVATLHVRIEPEAVEQARALAHATADPVQVSVHRHLR